MLGLCGFGLTLGQGGADIEAHERQHKGGNVIHEPPLPDEPTSKVHLPLSHNYALLLSLIPSEEQKALQPTPAGRISASTSITPTYVTLILMSVPCLCL